PICARCCWWRITTRIMSASWSPSAARSASGSSLRHDRGRHRATATLLRRPPRRRDHQRYTWQDSADASTVWAHALASSSDPSFLPRGAVAWVLLQVVGAQSGLVGGDTLSKNDDLHPACEYVWRGRSVNRLRSANRHRQQGVPAIHC